ncbi:MAG: YihY/virulence factor BrkB family protein [Capnocytophaga sp.]|nr:YihY/virulence factor BrkB family protein [Capnocytophaga sp.]
MTKEPEKALENPLKKRLKKFPIIRKLIKLLKSIPLGKGSFTLYDLLKKYTIGIIEGALTYRASAISYSFFVAIFPFLLVVLNLIPYIPIENFQEDFWVFIDNLLPPGTHDFFKDIFFDIAGKKRAGLLSSVFVLSIFLTTNGINAIFGGFDTSYHITVTRGVIKQYFISMGVALLLIFLLLASVILWLAFEYIRSLGVFIENSSVIGLIKQGYFGFVAFISISILYYYGTPKRGVGFFSPGAFFTLLLFILTTYGYGVYIEHFAQYNQLYGSIGALLIFLLYIWLNATILLLGFELNASVLDLKTSNECTS